jgi:hypothetical protein
LTEGYTLPPSAAGPWPSLDAALDAALSDGQTRVDPLEEIA